MFWGLTYGGIETMLINIANAQTEMGAEVYVMLINEFVEPSLVKSFSDKVNVVQLHRKLGSRSPYVFWRMNRILLSINPDAIHLHGSELLGFLWCRRLRRVTSLTLHDLPSGTVRRGGSLLDRILMRKNTTNNGNVLYLDKMPRVFAISDAVHDMLLKKYGIESIVVNNGILTTKFEQRTENDWHSPFKVVQVSRLVHEKKGQDLLIEAAAKLKGLIDVTFVGEGASMDFLKDLACRLCVTENVHFLGKKNQDYIAQYLKDYDLFVQASRWEGFGLTVAEAMAAKVPVLVSEGQGPAEVTCGDTYGWLFKNGDADDLARQIQMIMENKDEAQQKAEAGYCYVRQTYDVSVTARKYLENYLYRK